MESFTPLRSVLLKYSKTAKILKVSVMHRKYRKLTFLSLKTSQNGPATHWSLPPPPQNQKRIFLDARAIKTLW